jgi:hypothetical protein
MRSPIQLTGDPDVDAELWARRLTGPSADAAPAAEALVGIGTARSLELLVNATRLPHSMSRGIAANAIGLHPLASAAAERLEELLRDPSDYVASAAQSALSRMSGGAPRTAATSIEDVVSGIADAATRIELVLAEARHVFEDHADGHWRSAYKDRYARLVLAELDADSALGERLLASRDRLLKMLTYRALELRRARLVRADRARTDFWICCAARAVAAAMRRGEAEKGRVARSKTRPPRRIALSRPRRRRSREPRGEVAERDEQAHDARR